LFYNNAYLLEKLKNEEESYYIYQKGMQFSTSILGDLNMLSNKFRPKLSIARIPKNINNIPMTLDESSLIDMNSIGPTQLPHMGKLAFQKKVFNKNNKNNNNNNMVRKEYLIFHNKIY